MDSNESKVLETEIDVKIVPVHPLTTDMLNWEIAPGLKLEKFLNEKCVIVGNGTVGGMYTIYETRAKEPPSILDANREIVERHIQALMESYRKDGYYFTLLYLNEKLLEIDGQHRFEAANRLGLPSRFMIMPGWSIKEVTVLNVNSRNWRPIDFLESYAKQKNPNYVRFKEFYDENEFDIMTCRILLTGKRMRGGPAMEDFRSGTMQIDDEMVVTAAMRARRIQAMRKFHPNGWKSQNFVEAMVWLMNTTGYDHDYMLEKLSKFPVTSLERSGALRVDEYLNIFEEKYNERRKQGKIQLIRR